MCHQVLVLCVVVVKLYSVVRCLTLDVWQNKNLLSVEWYSCGLSDGKTREKNTSATNVVV